MVDRGVDNRREPAAVRLQVDQRRAERPGRCADGDALQHTGSEQQTDALGRQEQRARADVDSQGSDDHGPAAQVVRQRPEHQQRDENDEGIDGEDRGQRSRREPELSLVDTI